MLPIEGHAEVVVNGEVFDFQADGLAAEFNRFVKSPAVNECFHKCGVTNASAQYSTASRRKTAAAFLSSTPSRCRCLEVGPLGYCQ